MSDRPSSTASPKNTTGRRSIIPSSNGKVSSRRSIECSTPFMSAGAVSCYQSTPARTPSQGSSGKPNINSPTFSISSIEGSDSKQQQLSVGLSDGSDLLINATKSVTPASNQRRRSAIPTPEKVSPVVSVYIQKSMYMHMYVRTYYRGTCIRGHLYTKTTCPK